MRLRKVLTTASLVFAGVSSARAELLMCQSCPTGTWSDGTLRECKNCLTTGVAACSSTTGKATSCKPGYGYSNGSCSICANGYYSMGGTKSCSNSWSLVKSYSSGSSSGVYLASNAYKVVLNGAGGGGGGGDCADGKGGKGGNGAQVTQYFYLSQDASYSYSVGSGGKGANGVLNAESNTEAKGGNGGSSSFSISGVISFTADGGGGGYGGVRGTKGAKNGPAGTTAGNGLGGTGGSGGSNDFDGLWCSNASNSTRKGGNGSNGSVYIYKLNQ